MQQSGVVRGARTLFVIVAFLASNAAAAGVVQHTSHQAYSTASPSEISAGCYNTYCNGHGDLKNAFCGGAECNTAVTAAHCKLHWEEHGKKEGRGPDPEKCLVGTCDSSGGSAAACYNNYCNKHDDLMQAFCGGRCCQTGEVASKCKNHWELHGRQEGRAHNPEECASAGGDTFMKADARTWRAPQKPSNRTDQYCSLAGDCAFQESGYYDKNDWESCTMQPGSTRRLCKALVSRVAKQQSISRYVQIQRIQNMPEHAPIRTTCGPKGECMFKDWETDPKDHEAAYVKFGWVPYRPDSHSTKTHISTFVKAIGTADGSNYITLKRMFNCFTAEGQPVDGNKCFTPMAGVDAHTKHAHCMKLTWTTGCPDDFAPAGFLIV